MIERMKYAIYATVIYAILPLINGHGRLIDPPSRSSAWRYGFSTPPNYNDHELFCGGFTRQWVNNGGKCGVCGDPWDSKVPRANEIGGTYGQGVITRQYDVGSIISIKVELTANHYGYFIFAICSNYKTASQECLDKNVLKTYRPQENIEYSDVRYYPKEGNKVYDMKYRLPKMVCPHCLLQWRYIAGNNWGTCPNKTEMVGCGNQEEFRGCADISIGQGVATEVPVEPEITTVRTTTTTTTISSVPHPEETYSPITAIIISIMSFLVAFLIFFLLYFHYYQIGKKVKTWIKMKSENKNDKRGLSDPVPIAPPRLRRSQSQSEGNDRDAVLNV